MATPLVLVVGDDRPDVDGLRQALEDEGYRVESVRSTSALAVARRVQPQLILLDLSPPGTNGKKACTRLRANAATRAIPLVAVSASRPEEYDDIAVDDRLSKPYSRGDLYTTVARWTTPS
jgi:CheY-like chemotaxis protein